MYPHAHVHVTTCAWLCIHMYMAVCTCACGHVSRWSCIHGHMAVYSHAEFDCALWAIVMTFIKRSRPRPRILLSVMTTFFFYAQWATAQNFVKCYGPQPRIIDHSAASHRIHLKSCHNLHWISKARKCTFTNCTFQALYHSS